MKDYEFLKKEKFDYGDVIDILRALRADDGCPWDKVQTHESIRRNAVEEAYELSAAIKSGNKDNVVEELGDLLMQVLFHVCIAEEQGEFTAEDVYNALCKKLISRHTHVFGDVTVSNEKEALANWNANKVKEHKLATVTENLDDVPEGMASLMRAQKVQNRAAKGGYDFANDTQAYAKIKEEVFELKCADKLAQRHEEGGDLLFAVVNVLRRMGVDSETALMDSTDKFVSRVKKCEQKLNGNRVSDLTNEQFDDLWEKVKEI